VRHHVHTGDRPDPGRDLRCCEDEGFQYRTSRLFLQAARP
jgi:hypothetical protein